MAVPSWSDEGDARPARQGPRPAAVMGAFDHLKGEKIMRIRHRAPKQRPGRLEMTSMIDIVFLLLVFFVMTFTVVAVEGDFNVETAARARGATVPRDKLELPPMRLRLAAHHDGSLATIRLNDRNFGSFNQLHHFVLALAAEHGRLETGMDGFVVDLDCDEHLHYSNVIAAITAISGDLRADGSRRDLIGQIRFL